MAHIFHAASPLVAGFTIIYGFNKLPIVRMRTDSSARHANVAVPVMPFVPPCTAARTFAAAIAMPFIPRFPAAAAHTADPLMAK